MKLLPTYKGQPIFYGWIIVTALLAINFISNMLMTINFGLFINPMSEELGISQSIFGWSQTTRLLGVALSGLVIGKALDKYGTRIPLIVASIIIFFSMYGIANIGNGVHLLIASFFIGLIGMSASGGNLYSIVPISQWFVKKRSKAMSIIFMGLPIGILITMPLTQLLIMHYNWRKTIMILGIIASLVVFVSALFIDKNPEAKGLKQDGETYEKKATDVSQKIEEGKVDCDYSWSRKQVIRSFAFWKLALVNGIFFFVATMIAAFRIPHFVHLGIDPLIVSYSISFEAAVSIVISFFLGYFSTKFEVRYLLTFSTIGLIVFFFISIYSTNMWHVFFAQAVFGITIQSRFVYEGILWPEYFGKANVGSIRGLVVPISMVFSFLGAPLAGFLYDKLGSYSPAWWISIVLAFISVLLLINTPKPEIPK